MIDVFVLGLKETKAYLANVDKQMKFATAVALTRTAKNVMEEQKRLLPGELDRPKPGTVSAIKYTRATPKSLISTVAFKKRGEGGSPAAEYLAHNVSGGRRGMKRSEIMLRKAGILPAGMYTIPGKGADLDAYGNMSRGQIVSILSYFQTFGKTSLNSTRMNMSEKRRARMVKRSAEYVIVVVRDRALKLYPGIWKNSPDKLIPVLMFVKPGQHHQIVKFYETGHRVAWRDFQDILKAAFNEAMSTAR